MKTFKVTFSGGGRLVVTYELDISPRTWEATSSVPKELQKKNSWCGVGSFRLMVGHKAELAGETVEVEDDGGHVDFAEM